MVDTCLVRHLRAAIRVALSLGTLASAVAQTSTYVASTYAGGGETNIDGPVESARLYAPMGLAVDREGDIYVAEVDSRTIRRISSGIVTTLAGSPVSERVVRDGVGSAARLVFPQFIAVDTDRNVYVTSNAERIVQRITPAGVVTTLVSGDALTYATSGIAVDSKKNIYVESVGPREVRRISPAGAVTPLLQRPIFGSSSSDPDYLQGTPRGIAVDADDMIHVLTESDRYKITPAGTVSRFTLTDRFGSVQAMALDQAGNAYVVDLFGYNVVTKVTPAGGLSAVATRANSQLSFSSGIAVASSGSVLASVPGANAIFQIAPDGAVSKVLGSPYNYRDGPAENALFFSPLRIAADLKGNVYVASNGLRRIDAQRNVTTLQSSATGFVPLAEPPNPAPIGGAGLATDQDGNIYTCGNQVVQRVSPAGVVSTLAGTLGASGTADGMGAGARFTNPTALTVDGNGNIFVVDGEAKAVRKITPAGVVTTFAGSMTEQGAIDGIGSAARFSEIRDITVIGETVYVADYQAVRKIAVGGVVTTLAGRSGYYSGPSEPLTDGKGLAVRFDILQGMTADGAGNLYVIESQGVRKVAPDGTVTTIWRNSNFGYLYDIAADPTGNLFFSNDTRIYKLSPQPSPPTVEQQPRGYAVPAGASFSLAASTAGNPTPTIQWQQNGRNLTNGAVEELSLPNVQPAQTGIYRAVFTNTAGTKATRPVIVGLTTTSKVLGAGRELEPHDIRHPNGNVFDQVLLEGPTAAVTADYSPDPTRSQITRVSFVDLDDDIVQVEFSGPGTLSILLDGSSGPALPLNYQQDVAYMKGHAGIVIGGATEQTNVSIFSVGRATAVNQTLFKGEVNYGGMADLAFIAISSANGRFGGLRAANASFYATRGLTGVFAPGVVFEGPVYIGNVSAFDTASPVLQIGRGQDVRITGGDLFQANSRPIEVSGIARLQFTAGSDSHGKSLPVRTNRATLVTEGRDVTADIVVSP